MKSILKFVIFVLLGVVAFHLCFAILASACAHADPVAESPPITVPVPVVPALPIEAWIALALGALAGLVPIARFVSFVLGIVAKRTPNTVDDAVHAKLDEAIAGLDELRAALLGVRTVPAPTPEPLPVVRDPQSGRGALSVLVALSLALAAGGVGYSMLGCSTAERGVAAGKVAVVDCAKPQLATAAALIARWGVEAALAGKADWAAIETQAAGFGLGVGSCAYAEFLRAWKAKPTVQALAAAAPPEDDGSAGLERLRAQLGGAQIRLADGTVM